MYQPEVSNRVRLTHDLPDQSLHRGEQGTIKSTWFSPTLAFEVEFRTPGASYGMRVVLSAEQIEPGTPRSRPRLTRGREVQ